MAMPRQESAAETDIANMHQKLMDVEQIPTSVDDVPSKHAGRQTESGNKKLNDAKGFRDARDSGTEGTAHTYRQYACLKET